VLGYVGLGAFVVISVPIFGWTWIKITFVVANARQMSRIIHALLLVVGTVPACWSKAQLHEGCGVVAATAKVAVATIIIIVGRLPGGSRLL
jgi:hypothetical protein